MDHASEFILANNTIAVGIEGVEGVVDVEVWVALEALASGLCRDLSSEVSPPDVLEGAGGGWQEAVITAVDWVAVVRATAFGHTSVGSIEGKESVRELAHVQSAVTTCIIAFNEEVNLILSGENADSGKTISKLELVDLTITVRVKDLEGINHIEVRLEGKIDLLTLNIILSSDHVTEAIDHLILVSWGESRLTGAWARVTGRRGDGRTRG